jgi:hypothetical protein
MAGVIPRFVVIMKLAALIVAMGPSSSAGALPDGSETISLLDEILKTGPRFIGLDGHRATADILERRLASLPSIVVVRDEQIDYQPDEPRLILHDIDQLVPHTELCQLTLPDGEKVELFPFWPNGARLCTTPPNGIRGPLVYVGEGTEKELPAKSLRGAIVAMEYNSFDRWMELVQFGPQAILFLRPDSTSWAHSFGKYADLTFHCPRFYIDNSAVCEWIRAQGNRPDIHIVSRMRWESKPVRNFVVILPGEDPDLRQETIMASVRYDAGCVVPQLSYGAEQAISAAVLVEAATYLASRPRKRTLVLMWGGADAMNFVSLRSVLHVTRRTPDTETYRVKDRLVNEERIRLETKIDSIEEQDLMIDEDLGKALRSSAEIRGRFRLPVKRRLAPMGKELKSLRLKRKGRINEQKGAETVASIDARIEALRSQRGRYDEIMIALQRNRIGPEQTEALSHFTGEVTEQGQSERAEAQVKLRRLIRDIVHLRPYLDRDDVIAFFAPDISSHGHRFGLYWQTHWRNDENFGMLSRLAQRLIGNRKKFRFPDLVYRGFIDDTMEARRDWDSDVCCPLATSADPAQHFALMSLAMVTADDGRWTVDSPLDRAHRINRNNIVRQVPGVCAILERSVQIPDLRLRFMHRYTRVHKINGQAVVPTPGDTKLDVGLPGRIAIVNTFRPVPRAVGIRWPFVQLTSSTGHFEFPYVSRSYSTLGNYWVDVFGLGDHGQIIEAANFVDAPKAYKFKEIISLGSGTGENGKAIMFDCRPQYLGGLRDPRYVHDLKILNLLDQRSGNLARHHAERIGGGLGGLFLDPNRRWMMTARRGNRGGVRLLMTNATKEQPLGAGLSFDEPIRSAFQSTLTDFQIINESRIRDLADSGVVAPLAHELNESSGEALSSMTRAIEDDEAAQAMYHGRRVFAIQQVLYNYLRRVSHDTVASVVFLLLVLLPFSFYTERLLLNSATIYGRIGGFVTVFLVMMGLLVSFHPAFRLAMTPMIVLLAFVIIVLSTVVIIILYFRFAEQLRGGLTGEHNTSLSRLNVISQAMLVGISNMRRRKIRTTFTLVTLMVMTFALLSLSGTRTELSERRIGVGVAPIYPGVMINHVGWRKLPAYFLEQMEASYSGFADVGGQYWIAIDEARPTRVFSRYLVVRRNDGSDDRFLLKAVLGIGPKEHRFLKLGSQTRRAFDRIGGDPNGCILPREAVDSLELTEGDEVRLAGKVFTLTGVLDDETLSGQRFLNGLAYGPIDLDRTGGDLYYGETSFTEVMIEPEIVRGDLTVSPMDRRHFGIINAQTAREMGGTLRSVCIRAHDKADVGRIASEISTQRLLPVYEATEDDVQLVATRTKLGVIGLEDLFIPLFIGGLIVMNTMINAVADQRSSIHIYTSLGLAPVHVGVLFLSEAAALGTLGVVGGFILGQGFGVLTQAAGWFSLLTLSYSSTAVMLTMFLVMFIVLLSAVYPAMMASRLAAPAESRRWELPQPRGDQMALELPFTVSETTASGIPAFLRQWVTLHSQSGVGVFISDENRLHRDERSETMILEAKLWLAPFDLGVSQTIRLQIAPAREDSPAGTSTKFFQVSVAMSRRSGQRVNWYRSNRAFVAELRKQFLLWRTLSQARQQGYIEATEEILFESAESPGRLKDRPTPVAE